MQNSVRLKISTALWSALSVHENRMSRQLSEQKPGNEKQSFAQHSQAVSNLIITYFLSASYLKCIPSSNSRQKKGSYWAYLWGYGTAPSYLKSGFTLPIQEPQYRSSLDSLGTQDYDSVNRQYFDLLWWMHVSSMSQLQWSCPMPRVSISWNSLIVSFILLQFRQALTEQCHYILVCLEQRSFPKKCHRLLQLLLGTIKSYHCSASGLRWCAARLHNFGVKRFGCL